VGTIFYHVVVKKSNQPKTCTVFILTQGQMRTDRYATYGSLLGGVASFAVGYTAMPGLILGLVSGTLTAGLIVNPLESKKTNKS
jgi:hypothetical protein